MRLDYNVLWVEDQQQNVQSQCTRISLGIKGQGFKLQTKFASSVEEASTYLSDDIYGDHIDLVLMDYDLGAGKKGDEGLIEVRRKFPYKDIVFYSAQTDLLHLVAEKHIEGIFCSSREYLPDVVTGIFEALVRKVLDIDHSRGIVMGVTSDIDYYIKESINTIFDKNDEKTNKFLLAKVAEHLSKKEKSFAVSIGTLKNISNISELEQHHSVYTSNDKIRLLLNALELDSTNKVLVTSMKAYINTTIPKRNILAHVKVTTDGFSRKLINTKTGKEITSAEMKTLRKELLSFSEEIEGIFKKLSE